MSEQPHIICLYGPTAAGKTDLAIALHEHLNGDIISVDSALIYRDMNIGTAKPTATELARAPHRLIDICDPAESYSAAQFATDAKREIDAILAAGRTPILVGGTMLYFKALLEGFSDLPESQPEVRAALQAELEERGSQALHDDLKVIDSVSAERIHPNDPQRILRALEVFRISGRSLTELSQSRTGALNLPVKQLAIAPQQRQTLHQRIADRFELMLQNGFIEEVKALRQRGDLHLDLPSMRCVGYRQVWQYLDDELSYDQMVEKGVVATRQLAKRQLTWLRGWPGVTWLQPEAGKVLAQAQQALAQPAQVFSEYEP